MRPKLIFHAEIVNEEVNILHWDLNNPKKELMPVDSLKKEEIKKVFGKKIDVKNIKFVPEARMSKLKMRDKILKRYKKAYRRR